MYVRAPRNPSTYVTWGLAWHMRCGRLIWRAFLGKQLTGTAYGFHRPIAPGPGIVVRN